MEILPLYLSVQDDWFSRRFGSDEVKPGASNKKPFKVCVVRVAEISIMEFQSSSKHAVYHLIKWYIHSCTYQNGEWWNPGRIQNISAKKLNLESSFFQFRPKCRKMKG